MRTTRTLAVAALLLATPLAWASVSTEAAAKLGTSLTAVGAEKAANADGSIPEYKGGLTTAPAGYKKGDGLLKDPFADEKPLNSVTGANAAQYTGELTAGAQALLKRFADFQIGRAHV